MIGSKDTTNKIIDCIGKYSEKHKLAKECGGEYIYQNDSAQVDAIKLVSDIFDIISTNDKENEDGNN